MKQLVFFSLFALASSLAHAVDAEPAPASESFDFWAWIAAVFEAQHADDAQPVASYVVKSDGVIYD